VGEVVPDIERAREKEEKERERERERERDTRRDQNTEYYEVEEGTVA